MSEDELKEAEVMSALLKKDGLNWTAGYIDGLLEEVRRLKKIEAAARMMLSDLDECEQMQCPVAPCASVAALRSTLENTNRSPA